MKTTVLDELTRLGREIDSLTNAIRVLNRASIPPRGEIDRLESDLADRTAERNWMEQSIIRRAKETP